LQNKITYRKDIDGLRAIAVIGVILYHSEIFINENLIFSGGFLGVDVFFVISGYLITSIIIREYSFKKKFSFLNFYERRIRRLIPALLFVLTTALILAYFFLLPVQFETYLKSTISSIFFYSNFYFHYTGQAYGQMIMSTKPLLHTWSLSVEEQFYIIFPLLFIFIFNIFRDNTKYILFIFIIFSLFLSTYITHSHSSFSFYMIFTRAWELICGSVIALNNFKNKKKNGNSFLKTLGLLLIIFAFFFFDRVNQHPSYLTLVPVLGSCLVINNQSSISLCNKILTYKIFVKIGLISYSLYLWHHPLLSFGKISGFTENSFFSKIILISLSFLLSYFTYNFVEQKFRNKKLISIQKVISSTVAVVLLLIFFSITLPEQQKNKFPKLLQNLYEQTWFTTKQFYKPCFQRKNTFCFFGEEGNLNTLFLVGDSILASLQEELKNNLKKEKINFIPMTNAGCDFVKISKLSSTFCNENIQQTRDLKIKQFENSIIILHLNYKNVSQDEKVIKKFIDNINNYLEIGYKIILIYPIPQWKENISETILNIYRKDKNFLSSFDDNFYISIDYNDYLDDTKKITTEFDKLKHENLFTVYPNKIFCNTLIKNKCVANSLENIYFVDNSHPSKKGSEMINKELLKKIKEISN
jgi:peptidoglycan/LPS O-acetylase OafA/YrhL